MASVLDATDETGYAGLVEVEILNDEVWSTPGKQTFAIIRERRAQVSVGQG